MAAETATATTMCRRRRRGQSRRSKLKRLANQKITGVAYSPPGFRYYLLAMERMGHRRTLLR